VGISNFRKILILSAWSEGRSFAILGPRSKGESICFMQFYEELLSNGLNYYCMKFAKIITNDKSS